MAKAQSGGQRVGGKDFPGGALIPEKYRRQLETSERPRDPAGLNKDFSPNMGRFTVPHVITFSGISTSLSKAYRNHDQAMRHSVENAHMMLSDPAIRFPLLARQTMTSLLQWGVESEDDKDPKLQAVSAELKKIVERTPRFTELRCALLEAIWYGRYATQQAFGFHTNRFGQRRRVIRHWAPVSGDKLLFRYDDGSYVYDPNQIGVKVSPAIGKDDLIGGRRRLEATGEGMGYFLEPWERRHWCVHKHMIRDGEYEDPISGGQIHGVGLRHFLYWVWFQKQETLAQLAEVIDRTGSGITIYYYPIGNQEAKAQVEKVAREQAHTNVLVMPYDIGAGGADYSIQQIPPNTAGMQALQDLIERYFEDMIIRAILGQTLSSKPDATGLGSSVADLQKDSLFQIVRYDATNLEETITNELLLPLRDFNFPSYRNVDFFFKISTKVSAPEEELAAIFQAWQMGTKIRVSEVYKKLDMSMPDDDDQVIYNPQIVAAIEQIENPQLAPPLGSLPPGGVGPQPPGAASLNPTQAGGGVQNDPPRNDENIGENADSKQLDKQEDDQQSEKQKLFGPILYAKGSLGAAIEAAAQETDTNPSPDQRKQGNFKKGRVWVRGVEIAIENPKGTKRKPEWNPLACHYGYVTRHSDSGAVSAPDGKDGDKLDVYLGPDPDSEIVFVIDQPNKEGKFDEHKTVLFTRSEREARELYLANYPDGWKCGAITALTWPQFRSFLTSGDPTKPLYKQVLRYGKQMSFAFDEDEHPRAKEHVELAGKEYEGGQWIPKDKAQEATPAAQEKIEVVDEDSGDVKPLDDVIESKPEEKPSDAGPEPVERDPAGGDAGQPVEREPGSPGDLGANRVKPPEERIVVSRGQHTSPGDRSLVPEKLRQHLDDHQQEGVAKSIASLRDNGGVLVADGTGVGKTRQLLAVGQHYLDEGKTVLVIAPKGVTKADWAKKTVTGSWKNDSEAMGIPLNVTRDDLIPGAVNISSYENLSKLKDQVDSNTVLLFDESHSLKNYDSARSKHGTEMADKAHAVLFATATPVDKVEHLHYLDRAGAFGGQYYGKTYEQLGLDQVEQRVPGGQTIKKWQVKPGVKASEVMRRMSGLFDRLTKDGLMVKREISMEGVPVSVEQINLPPEAHEMLARIEKDLAGSSANAGLERARILMHQRRQQEPYKVPHAVNMALDAIKNGRQVVIFASRVNESTVGDEDDEDAITSEGTMKLLREELQKQGVSAEDIAEIHGGMKKNQIPKEMDRFQSGKAKVVIATVESGGTGINLDDTTGDKPRTLIMMTAPFSAVENVQAAGRVWRLKTKSTPELKYLFADTEVDDWNSALISKKMQTLGASVKGQIGKLDVSKLDESSAIDFEPEDPYEWKYPGEGQSPAATFSRLDSGEWGLRVEGKIKPGDVVQVTKRDGSKDHKTVGSVVRKGKGFTLVSISDKPAARVPREELPSPPPPEQPAKVISEEKKEAIHQAIKQLASMDEDRAQEINNVGFNKFDGQFGHSLASQSTISTRQAEAAEKLVNKYRGQLPEQLVSTATKKEEQPKPSAPPPVKASSHPFESLANWSKAKNVTTSQGPRIVRSAVPTEKFWSEWRKDKEKLKRQGISVSKYQGEWQISWWQESPEKHAKRYAKMFFGDQEEDSRTDVSRLQYAKSQDSLPGGLADDSSSSDFDQGELKQGIQVELEHTDDPKIAAEIARDHISEFPNYYDALKDMEQGLKEVSRLRKRLEYAKELSLFDAEPKQYACSCAQKYQADQEGFDLHSLGHIGDQEYGIVSASPEWLSAWESEIAIESAPLSSFAASDPQEGFAEFMRLVLSSPEKAQKSFPGCWEVLESKGLVD